MTIGHLKLNCKNSGTASNNLSVLICQKQKNGTYLIDIPQEKRLGHEEHFSKVAKAFLHYVHNQDMPEWENENTLAKYYITTTAVEMAKKGNK